MYLNLQGEMKKISVKRKDLQQLLGIGSNTIWARFNDKTKPFNLAEAKLIRDTYFPKQSIDELFWQEL